MFEFAWPWVLLVLPLPWIFRYLLPAADSQQPQALVVPFYAHLQPLAQGAANQRAGKINHRQWLYLIIWLLLVASACRPQWLGEPVELPVTGRDLMLAVDLSGSMAEEDMVVQQRVVDRLTALKNVLSEFILRREGDRLGLILFGTQAYLQAPLTFDRRTVTQLLDESVINLAGKNTAIGDAIGLAVKRLRERPEGQRVLILMTDGANTAGQMEPLKAAELAAQAGVKIYTIGVGAGEVLRRTLLGVQRVNTARDLDESTLQKIAELTGGEYFRARDPQGLEAIYQQLDQLEPLAEEAESFRPLHALYMWPLGAAVLLSLGFALWSLRDELLPRREL